MVPTVQRNDSVLEDIHIYNQLTADGFVPAATLQAL